jgi:hypothetical protein
MALFPRESGTKAAMKAEDFMRAFETLLTTLALTTTLASSAFAATITGTVKGPDGKPLMGAFVVAENAKTKMTVSVLSNEDGHYYIGALPAATYKLRVDTAGYRSDPREDVGLTADQSASFDFTVQKRAVRWSDLSTYQGRMLLPKTPAHDLEHKDPFFVSCFQSCHSFQHRMTTAVRDEDGWRDRVRYMSDTMMAGDGRRLNDKEIEDYTAYLTVLFGPETPKPNSPEDLPQYKSLARSFGPKSMNIAYVEYDFPAPGGMGPWSAAEDKDGKL